MILRSCGRPLPTILEQRHKTNFPVAELGKRSVRLLWLADET